MLIGHVAVRAPFPWRHMLDYFAHRLIPQFERIENDCYVRQVGTRTIAVAYDSATAQLQVTSNGRVKVDQVLHNVGRLFDVGYDAQRIQQHLRRSPVLKRRIANVPGMRPIGAWSPFELCVRTILGQQVSVAAAGTLMRRLVERCGSVTPECVADADFTNFGMPGKRVETIRSFARAAADGKVDFGQPWPQVEAALQSVAGIRSVDARLSRNSPRSRSRCVSRDRSRADPRGAGRVAGAAAGAGGRLAALSGLCGDLPVGGERKRARVCDPRLDLPILVTWELWPV